MRVLKRCSKYSPPVSEPLSRTLCDVREESIVDVGGRRVRAPVTAEAGQNGPRWPASAR